jgi:Mg/Co/Ni transporter MgtE
VLGGDRTQPVEALMSRTVPTVKPQDNALSLCHQFRDGRFARMAVVDEQGRLIGNLSRGDVMRMMVACERMERENRDSAAPGSTACATTPMIPAPRGMALPRKPTVAVCPS